MHFLKSETTFVKMSSENPPGWEKYNGQIGETEFVDGYSAEELNRHQIYRISSSVNLVAVQKNEDGTFTELDQVGALYEVGDATKETPSDYKSLPTAEELGVTLTEVGDEIPQGRAHNFTRERLAEIADASGIKGLRELAERYEIRGRSIEQIIDEMMTLVGEAQNSQNTLDEFNPNAESLEAEEDALISSEITEETSSVAAETIDVLVEAPIAIEITEETSPEAVE